MDKFFFKKQPKGSGFVIAFLVQRVLAELKSPKIVFSSKLMVSASVRTSIMTLGQFLWIHPFNVLAELYVRGLHAIRKFRRELSYLEN